MTSIDWQAEIELDPTIQFRNQDLQGLNNQDLQGFRNLAGLKNPQAILLTGMTGFLGVYLLVELLHQTEANIYCLVRGDNQETAQQRLKAQLECYHLWQDSYQSRIVIVVGDLSKPYLGLTEAEFKQLGQQIQVIYHNGAQVNAMYSYQQLKATNVGGTIELLRLAAIGPVKSFHYISTMAVFFSQLYQNQVVLEEETVNIDATFVGGYKQSKWVSEQLVWQAKARGLPVCVFRPGRVVGDSHTGIIVQDTDLLWKIVRGCIALKKYPDVETTLNMMPVDYVAKAIVYLASQPQAWGKAFHLVNPVSISWSELWQHLQTIGYEVEPTAYDQWVTAINQQATKHPLFTQLRLLLRSPIALFKAKPHFDDHNSQVLLANSDIVCPTIDEHLLKLYLGSKE